MLKKRKRTVSLRYNTQDNLEQVVSIANPVYQSIEGKYFAGQSGNLEFSQGQYAWAALMNPVLSGVNLYVSTVTITNRSGQVLNAEFWMNALAPEPGERSRNVMTANATIDPLPVPAVELRYASTDQEQEEGVPIFDRLVPPQTSVTLDKDGKFVISPGAGFLIFLSSPEDTDVQAQVAFGWWEDKIE